MESSTPIADRFWQELRVEAETICRREPMLCRFLEKSVLGCSDFAQALGRIIAGRLASPCIGESAMFQICMQALYDDRAILESAACDMRAVCARDPASRDELSIPFLYLKGIHVLESWRIAHYLWQHGRKDLARYLQSIISDVYAVDIHPAAVIGRGIMLDHATGIVIGETARVADTVSMLHGVTLGGTGKDTGDRHPKVGRGVMIGAGAKILGNIRIGEGAKIGAGSVVLEEVAPHTTVAGVPARVVGRPALDMPSIGMDQTLSSDLCPWIFNPKSGKK